MSSPYIPVDLVAIRAEIEQQVGIILREDAIPLWWQTPIPAWGGRTPQQAFDYGDHTAVLKLARSYNDRNNEAFT